MKRRTIVVEGPLAFRMRRIVAARRSEAGIQIMTLPQLAARLAGGFVRPAQSQDLDPAIRTALEAGGFSDLESIRKLPGMTRSVARSEEHTSELQSLLGISYAVFCLKIKK